jgi:VWFA-related protein
MAKLAFTAVLAASGLLLVAEDNIPTAPVQMIVTVEARKGKNIPALNREDVMISEGKQRVPVLDFTPGEAAGLELFLLIDDASAESLGSQLDSLRHFIDNQPASTAVGLAYMQNGSAEIAQNLTKDHGLAGKALRLPFSSPSISPSPFESLSDLIKRWPASGARHEVIMISSGIDPIGGEVENPYLNAAIEHAQRSGIVVYAIYTPAGGHLGHSTWRLNWGQSHLAELAEKTGGESYMLGFGTPVSFAPYLDEVTEHLAHQYRVGFQPKAENKAGFQSVKVTTEVPNAELVAPSKVWVPAGL